MHNPFEGEVVQTVINFEALATTHEVEASIGMVNACCDRFVAEYTRKFAATWNYDGCQVYDTGAYQQLAFVKHVVKEVRDTLQQAKMYGLRCDIGSNATDIWNRVDELVTEVIEWHSEQHLGSSLQDIADQLLISIHNHFGYAHIFMMDTQEA